MIDKVLPTLVIIFLLAAMYILELYGAILVTILFAGFIYIIGNSRKYEYVNKFIDSFYPPK